MQILSDKKVVKLTLTNNKVVIGKARVYIDNDGDTYARLYTLPIGGNSELGYEIPIKKWEKV